MFRMRRPSILVDFCKSTFAPLFRFLDLLRLPGASRTTNISDLPEELLCEVFLYLDCYSILVMKQACKAFYQTTKSRQLWYNFMKELQAGRVRRPEEPLEEYSTGELEEWVLRRLRAQAQCNSLIPSATHQLPLIDFGSGAFAYSCILPGGRWLVVLTLSDKVYSIDLDAPRLKAYPLFKLGSYTKEGRLDGLAECCHWVDDNKSRLSFRMGFCGAMLTSGSGRFTFTRIVLFQVELKGHGPDATLVAEPLASMRSVGVGTRPQICLNAEYFVEFLCRARNLDDVRTTSNHLRSYRYRADGTPQEDVMPFVLPIESSVAYMDFISNNRIVAFDARGLQIFTISPSENDVQHTISLLHTIPTPTPLSFSCLYRTPQSTFKMVVFGDDEVRGVEIPDWDPSATIITKLGHQKYHWKTGARAAVGLSTGIVAHKDGSMDLISYSWGNEKGVTFGRRTHPTGFELLKSVLLSEDLARIIVNHREGTILFELDSEKVFP